MALPGRIKELLKDGAFIPAHPLALDKHLKLDEARQRALTRYYLDAGVDGIAIAVHTTQFEIRDHNIRLLEPVLAITADEIASSAPSRPLIKVAGICGDTQQAVQEATLAVKYGYDLGLLSNGGLSDWSNEALIQRARAVADIIPVFGFYLQPAVGGRLLDFDYWRSFSEINGVEAIKVASFNRYQTLDVVRAVAHSSRRDQVDLYTGNDDNLVADLLTPYRIPVEDSIIEKRFVGGLLGHWSVWTGPAVRYFKRIKDLVRNGKGDVEDLLALNIAVTDLNEALFDPAHSFKGCISGIHEILRRNGLLEWIGCINPEEKLSEGQLEKLDRVIAQYPDLTTW
jgi:dihydrodipicolinate synthase/N-acetylneuraminate lyase